MDSFCSRQRQTLAVILTDNQADTKKHIQQNKTFLS